MSETSRPHQIILGQRVTEGKVELALAMRRAMTTEEAVMWDRLRGRKLYGLKFRRQQIIDGYIADFYCHEAALVVKIDGPHHQNEAGIEYDDRRTKAFAFRGIRVLRFSNDQVRQTLSEVLECTAAEAASRKQKRPEES